MKISFPLDGQQTEKVSDWYFEINYKWNYAFVAAYKCVWDALFVREMVLDWWRAGEKVVASRIPRNSTMDALSDFEAIS